MIAFLHFLEEIVIEGKKEETFLKEIRDFNEIDDF